MWFERDLPRLNVLLELFGEWVRVGDHASLLGLLGRMKWVVDYRECFVAIDEGVDGAGVFSVRRGAVDEVDPSTLPASIAHVLTFIRAQRRIFAPPNTSLEVIGTPLFTDGNLIGVMILKARLDERYSQQDIRFVETIADYFAGSWWRIAMRERAQKQAVESRRKDEFLALLGHELRNPLAPMVTALELMRGGRDHAREREILERQVKHMTRLVDDLMDVARISRGALEMTHRRVLVREIVSSGLEMSLPALEARGHLLHIEQDDALAVLGDLGRLSQILTNLLRNAAKFSPSRTAIFVRAEASNGRVRIVVTDHGDGIEKKDLETVFERFVQLGDRGLDRPGGGLGLGLSLAREFARAHGGDLIAQSDGLGKGATFVLELPQLLSDEEHVAPAPKISEPSRSATQKQIRILLVDDNIDAAEMLTYMLEARAYEVRVVHDGEEALREAASFDPDVGILDIGLPGMSGYELAVALRRDPARARMRLVALSGYGRESDIAKGREAGFDAHLLKPVNFEALEKSLGLREMAPLRS